MVWSSSSLSMRRRSSATGDKFCPPAEKRCKATKAKVPRSRRTSSAHVIADSRNRAAVRRESADARRLSSCWTKREASVPPWVDAFTVPCRVSQGVNPPPVHARSREGFIRNTFLTRASNGREAPKCAFPSNTCRQDGSPLIRAWLRVASPFVLPHPSATTSQSGGRSLSPTTPHAKRKRRRERRSTFPPGATGKGDGRADTTPAVTTPCRAAVNACSGVSDRPSVARPIGTPPPPAAPCGHWGGVGRTVATAAGGVGLDVSCATVGVGAPACPLQALPPAVARGLLPPPGLCCSGGACENISRGPPLCCEACS